MLGTPVAALDELFHVDHGTLHRVPHPSLKFCTLVGSYSWHRLIGDWQQSNVILEKLLDNVVPQPYLKTGVVAKQMHIVFQTDKKMHYYV